MLETPPKKRTALKVALAAIAVGLVIFLWDLYAFSRTCDQWADVGRSGTYALPPVSSHEAIVVLTGDRRRIPKALELLRSRGSPLLLISGTGKGISLTELVNQQGDSAVKIHEHWEKIVLEDKSTSTIQNARNSSKVLHEKGVKRIILVTSEYHMNRSLMIFKKAVPDAEIFAYPVASDYSQKSLTGLWFFWLEYWKRLLFTCYTSRTLSP